MAGAMGAGSTLEEGVGPWVWQDLLNYCWLERKYQRNWMAYLGVKFLSDLMKRP